MTFTLFVSPDRRRAGLCRLGVAALLAVAACAPLPVPAPGTPPKVAPAAAAATTTPAAQPPTRPEAAPRALQIDSSKSLIAVTVRRGGVLARLGHDHVVAARNVGGTVWPAQNRAELQFLLDQMTVDEPALRRIAGLEVQPSADAIDGTRRNMLTKVLDADRYPLVVVRIEREADGQPLRVAITLHGVTRNYAIPVTLQEDAGVMTVSGTLTLRQSDFGLVPFSVMGGAMAVQDQMELRFTVAAS